MNSYFIEFRDPLFSIILFFVIIFIITFFSYWWSRYKSKEDFAYLDSFLQQFGALPSKDELSLLISKGELSEKSWLLLANSYFKNGDYEKSIDIYKEMLRLGSPNAKETMFLLGKTYFKAGFLERSRQIFLRILKKNPHTPQALHYLLLIYESMRNYAAALEVLEPLDELGEDVTKERAYFESLIILENKELSNETKTRQLLAIYARSHALTYLIFEYLFRTNPSLAWTHFDFSKSDLLSDIFWHLDATSLDLDIISKNGYLRELYSARGDYNLESSSSVFELDVLIKLQKKANATLSFEYVCTSCKSIFPFVFHRCSACHAIATSKVEYRLVKDYYKDFHEENNSFQ